MTINAGDTPAYHPFHARRDILYVGMTVPIGATGAVGTLDSDDPAMTCTRASAGTYNITFPKSVGGRIKTLALVGTTACGIRVSAVDYSAGTATIQVLVESTGTIAVAEAGNGDILNVVLALRMR